MGVPEGAMTSLNVRSSWTLKFVAVACLLGCFGKDTVSWINFVLPAFLVAPSWLQPSHTSYTPLCLLFPPAAAIEPDGILCIHCIWPRELLQRPLYPVSLCLQHCQGSRAAKP